MITEVVFTLSKPLIGKKPVQLINHLRPDLPTVKADESRVQQIMHNLIGNAIKFTEAGSITISAEVIPDNLLAVTVSDTGIGIPSSEAITIFQSFKQVDLFGYQRVWWNGVGFIDY